LVSLGVESGYPDCSLYMADLSNLKLSCGGTIWFSKFPSQLCSSFLYELISCRYYLLFNFSLWNCLMLDSNLKEVLSRGGFICGSCVSVNYKFVSWLVILGKTDYCFIICKICNLGWAFIICPSTNFNRSSEKWFIRRGMFEFFEER
jgi:hypothetical protein